MEKDYLSALVDYYSDFAKFLTEYLKGKPRWL